MAGLYTFVKFFVAFFGTFTPLLVRFLRLVIWPCDVSCVEWKSQKVGQSFKQAHFSDFAFSVLSDSKMAKMEKCDQVKSL